ncbi:uncharacterized protein [Littorina saxatilis]|uniref:Uncharacterized protein n=1 Tax=Littorina saxatilis TaxID=31220 RepID=A0AAN9AIG1_9CAEN
MPKGSNNRLGGRLPKFLSRYSTPKAKQDIKKLFAQWILVEVRDAGHKKNLICPCGRSGLRYLCFIRNVETKIQTYVGSTCIRHFCNKMVPKLLKLLESLSMQGVTGKYLGKAGKFHKFQLKDKAKVVKYYKLLSSFFSKLPVYRQNGVWEMRVASSKSRVPKDKLRPGYWYNLKLGPVTRTGINNKGRPALMFFADGIRSSRG